MLSLGSTIVYTVSTMHIDIYIYHHFPVQCYISIPCKARFIMNKSAFIERFNETYVLLILDFIIRWMVKGLSSD